MVLVLIVKDTTSHRQRRMNAWTRNAPPTNDWMIKETARIVKSIPILPKMVEHVRPDAMMTTRLFKRMGNA